MFTPVRLDEPRPTSIVRGSALAVTGLLAQGILRFATSLLVGRLAGKEELGIVASAIATATILALLWPTSTGSAASKFLARARGSGSADELRSTSGHLRTRMLQTGSVLVALSVPIWVYLDGGSWTGALALAALTASYAGYSFTRGVQFGTGQTLRATCWDVTCVAVGLAGLSVLLALAVRGPVLVLPLAAAYGLYALASWPFGRHGDRLLPERRRELDGFVALGAVGSLASAGFLQVSQIVARLIGDDAGAGQYAAALSLATPASMLATSLTLVLLPALSETVGQGDSPAFRARTDLANRGLVVVVVAVFGAILVCSRVVIEIMWGAKFAGADVVLMVLLVAVLTSSLAVVSVNALTARSQRGMVISVAAGLLGMVVGVAVWATVASALGEIGVALGYLSGAVTIAAVPIAVVWRSGEYRWGSLYGRVLVALAVLAALAWTQRSAALPLVADPLLAVGFVGLWWLTNRGEFARLMRSRPSAR